MHSTAIQPYCETLAKMKNSTLVIWYSLPTWIAGVVLAALWILPNEHQLLSGWPSMRALIILLCLTTAGTFLGRCFANLWVGPTFVLVGLGFACDILWDHHKDSLMIPVGMAVIQVGLCLLTVAWWLRRRWRPRCMAGTKAQHGYTALLRGHESLHFVSYIWLLTRICA